MANHQKPVQTNRNNNQDIQMTEELMKEWFSQQKEKLEIEKANTRLEELRIQSNERLAHKAIDYQARDFKSAPGEFRKHIITISSIAFAFALLFVLVILYLVNSGKDEFAYNMLKAASYVVVSVFSFFAGRKSRKGEPKKKEYVENVDAEEVD